jgi:hypothetical protein
VINKGSPDENFTKISSLSRSPRGTVIAMRIATFILHLAAAQFYENDKVTRRIFPN